MVLIDTYLMHENCLELDILVCMFTIILSNKHDGSQCQGHGQAQGQGQSRFSNCNTPSSIFQIMHSELVRFATVLECRQRWPPCWFQVHGAIKL